MSAWFWVSVALYAIGFVLATMWHFESHGKPTLRVWVVNAFWPLVVIMCVLVGSVQYLSDRRIDEHI